MSDQCRNCIVRGDLEKCKETDDCSIHDSWYTQQLLAQIEYLKKEKLAFLAIAAAANELFKCIDGWHSYEDVYLKRAELRRAVAAIESLNHLPDATKKRKGNL